MNTFSVVFSRELIEATLEFKRRCLLRIAYRINQTNWNQYSNIEVCQEQTMVLTFPFLAVL